MTETHISAAAPNAPLVRALLRLAGPVALARLGVMAMGVVDTIVVGQLAPKQLGYLALGWAPTSVVLVTGLGLLFGIPAGYALARIPMRGARITITLILATRMLPAISTVIPLYLVAASLHLLDTKAVLVVLYLSFVLPFAVWILSGFFASVPREVEEAAMLDGAGRLRTLRSVVLPVALPGVAATAIFSFLLAWDEFFFPLIFTSTRDAKMVPVAIAEFTGRHAVDFGAMATGGVLAAIPVVLVALVFNRLIVTGLTAGAVK